MDDNSCSKGCGFESRCRILDEHYFTLICCKNCIVCLKRPKINEKEAGVGPFFEKTPLLSNSLNLSTIFLVSISLYIFLLTFVSLFSFSHFLAFFWLSLSPSNSVSLSLSLSLSYSLSASGIIFLISSEVNSFEHYVIRQDI